MVEEGYAADVPPQPSDGFCCGKRPHGAKSPVRQVYPHVGQGWL